MSTRWNAAAEAALERHLDRIADPFARLRMCAALRARIEHFASGNGADGAVGPEDVDRVLATSPASGGSPGSNLLLILFGILLPIASVIVAVRVDPLGLLPLPTPWHAALVLSVPAACIMGLAARARMPGPPGAVAWFLAGVALATSIGYAIGFLPAVPLGILGIFIAGLGLLVLSPYFALVAIAWLIGRLRARTPANAAPGFGPGLAAGVVALVWLDLAWLPTTWLIADASPADRAAWSRTLGRLRLLGNLDALACLARGESQPPAIGPLGQRIAGLLPRARRPDAAAAAAAFYQLTGESYETRPAAARARDAWLFEERPASAVVLEARDERLTARSSRVDGTVDADGGVAYLEWQLRLRNDGDGQAEATAEIRLPPDAVVSRLTLWVAGEERDAAWSEREAVQRAYDAVRSARRDPVVVTTFGPGRVLVRCFPVVGGAAGGEQRFKLGISVPLLLLPDEARLVLPEIVRSNFAHGRLRHDLWLESGTELHGAQPPGTSAALRSEGSGRSHVVRGTVPDATWHALACAGGLRFRRAPAARVASHAPARGPHRMVLCHHEPLAMRRPEEVVVVLDAGASLAPWRNAVVAAITRLCARVPARVLVAEPGAWRELDPRAMSSELAGVEFAGGTDAQDALEEAWDIAAGRRDARILWLCGPQPWLAREPDGLRQRLERRPDGPRLVTLQLAPGTNQIQRSLAGCTAAQDGARVGELDETIDRACGLPTPWLERRYEVLDDDARLAGVSRTSDHLARLQAAREIATRLAQPIPDRAPACALALAHRLVTPVSGAVVLETQAQYDAAGLVPATAEDVPRIPPGGFGAAPEPMTWVLFALGGVVLSWAGWGRKRS